jgi:hypothetical protein
MSENIESESLCSQLLQQREGTPNQLLNAKIWAKVGDDPTFRASDTNMDLPI